MHCIITVGSPLNVTRPIPAPGSAAIIPILVFREWKRSIDRLTDKNAAKWIDS